MKQVLAAMFCAASLLGLPTAHAETYPSRPIIMLAPLSAGGSTDVIARIMAEGMRKFLGQPVIVENAAGAGGTIGEGRLARSTPDGYTFGIGQWGTNMANGAIYPLTYDLINDFEPIGLIATQPFFIDSKKAVPANDLKGLIAWIKQNEGKVTEGNSGIGSPSHVAGLLFQKAAGVTAQMIPFRGAGESMQALVAGHIDIQLDAPPVASPQMRAGTIKTYAVAAPHRLSIAPDVPTTDEAGLPGFYFSFWHAFWAPKGTPKEIVAKLNEALRAALNDPATRQKLIDFAQEIYPPEQQTPEALLAFHKAEIAKWWPIIKAANIKIE